MKHLNKLTRRSVPAILAALTLAILFGAGTAARAQDSVRPFVDCVEREYSGGAETGNYIAYFGYSSDRSDLRVFPAGGQNNFFFTNTGFAGENGISVFKPGVHPRVELVRVPIGQEVRWFLGTGVATASFNNSNLCAADGANSRLITYQGKLSDGGQAANGTYDLQFQLFNALTGGEARTSLITLDNVQVTGGVFTVRLDLGANALINGNPAGNLKLNPAILDAENSFFEISVRAGTSTGAFTKLTPRQPVTAVPLAMRANTANNAFRAANADRGSNNFTVDGNAQVNGNLTVSGSISGASKNFKIDHPLDPLNKTLTYTSVESPDMKNIYDGNVTTNAEGEAIVTMPAYFEALNRDFRYQLTVIGTFAQAIVSEEIKGNTFKIKTDKPNVKVSWQVTGIRHDRFAEDKQTQVEQEKSAADKGKCLYTPACLKEKQ